MRIALVSPLYPPDIEAPAPYVKELATRLSKTHSVTILTYGELPEQIPNVHIIAISKKISLVRRLMAFTRTLVQLSREVDVLIIENGPSVELPTLIARMVGMRKGLLHKGDPRSVIRSSRNIFFRILRTLVEHSVPRTLLGSPNERPEILPFDPYPHEAFKAYEHSWASHLFDIETLSKTI